jgi:aryl-alcohol dehydrogenase-like predicted oxidoreductase
MQYTQLGRSGLTVSRIGLGCMSYGQAAAGMHQWTLDEDAAASFFEQAVELGVTFWDTANTYQGGTSEEFVGRAVERFSRREDIVLATKVYGRMHDGPGGGGLSRKAILEQLDASLRRLATDYVDVYYIHRFDEQVPVEETMEALHDVVKAGKARYIGASSMHAWQFAKALYVADLHGWTRFISMQNHLNLLNREEEREMLPLCRAESIGVIPWSPLARGRLTRDWSETTKRSETDQFSRKLYTATEAADSKVVARVAEVAAKRGVPRAQVALAWVAQKSPVTAPIIGAGKAQHLDDAVAALSLNLTEEEIASLEEPYVPHAIAGYT